MANPEPYDVKIAPFPAQSKTSTATINGIETTATSLYFSDKILITISQSGRLAHWLHVPLLPPTPDSTLTTSTYEDADPDAPPSDLLPMSHLTATTILGGTLPELDTMGQLLATQVASAILTRDAKEERLVVVGLGFEKSMVGRGRSAFAEVVGLVLGVL